MENQIEDVAWSTEKQVYELTRRLQLVGSKLLVPKLPDFEPAPDDVIVAVPPKNGATWLSYICHQIRTKGEEPNFETQYEVITYLEGSEAYYGRYAAKQQSPSISYTQLPYPAVPKGGKLIFCFRDQKDAMISAYHFFDSVLFLKGRVALPVFANVYIQQIENHINGLLNWWEHRHDDNLLLVFFDDLKEDHTGSVRQIAKHMGVDCDEDAIARVVHTTSHAEMSKHASKFSDSKLVSEIAKEFGEEVSSQFVGKVRKSGGKSGEGKEQLPADIQQRIDQLWQEIVTTKLGFKDLNEMREAWRKDYRP